MQNERPLNIPVLLGTVRKGRASAHVARFLLEQVRERERVVTELIDLTKLSFPIDDAGQAIKDKDLSEKMNSADGLVIVVPEYNHSCGALGRLRFLEVVENTVDAISLFLTRIFYVVDNLRELRGIGSVFPCLQARFFSSNRNFLWTPALLPYPP